MTTTDQKVILSLTPDQAEALFWLVNYGHINLAADVCPERERMRSLRAGGASLTRKYFEHRAYLLEEVMELVHLRNFTEL